MKAKIKNQPRDTGVYHCIECGGDSIIHYGERAQCSLCKNTKALVIIHKEDDPQEEMMYTDADWHGG